MAAHDDDVIFVDIDGNEVAADDPAVQTRYTRGEFKALDKAVVFGAKGHAKAAHDEAHDPDNAADPVVAGVPTPDGDVEKTGRGKK